MTSFTYKMLDKERFTKGHWQGLKSKLKKLKGNLKLKTSLHLKTHTHNGVKLFTSTHKIFVVIKRRQHIKIKRKKYIPAFYILKQGHILSIHFQGIFLCIQKQKEAKKSKQLSVNS